ncbi:hypothetical protein D0Z08_09920 [Nocardioides immobilis]|uniref:Anti-sigma K factor RskA C-terminal domain-containing protein n=1 Tax=Nocardioides immobilis TaxID=2049295 RepID=A0A417Y4H0_9ACTN|nr:anti-sigma factor [Nocardioides immobilis]RHW27451.1 hypothetical protein D0Z08_09920 [Nocardioides immobilis]
MRKWPLLVALVVGALAVALVVGWLVLRDEEGDPDLAVALSGSGGTASGDIKKLPSGWRIELDADLPRLDDGDYYQAWLSDDAGTLVPIGTFNEGEDVVLWAGVSPLEFTTLTVTRERADGDQDSSGDRILSGEIEPESG